MTIVWIKVLLFFCTLAQLFFDFLCLFKNIIIYNFVVFVATKEAGTKKFFLSTFVGSGIRDKHPGFATMYWNS